MEAIIQQNNTGAVSRSFIRDGVAGNYDLIFEMVRVIRYSVNYDLGLERLAKSLLIDKGLNSYSPQIKQLETVYKFVTRNVAYIQDKGGLIESIKSAKVTLSDGYGDCDDLTNTIITLVALLGFEDVKIAMAKYSPNDHTFSHVYPVVYLNNGARVVLDASLPNGVIGDEVHAYDVKEIDVFGDVKGLDGVSGLFNNTKRTVKKFGKIAIEAIPLMTGYLPLGFVSSQALATGAQLIGQSGSPELSLNATASKVNRELDKIIVSLIRSRMAIDAARGLALHTVSQLGTANTNTDAETYNTVSSSVKNKLEFINNFENFAKANNIKVVHLNASAMLATGVIGAAFGGYTLYKMFSGNKGN